MTYIELINRFWKIDMQVQFSGLETKMYLTILNVANELHWKTKFLSIPNGKLLDSLQCSKPTLLKIRQKLVDCKLITYKPGKNKRTAPIYTIVMNQDFVIDVEEVNNSTGKKTLPLEYRGKKKRNIFNDKLTLIKDKDKDKNKYGEKEKLHDGSAEVYDFFRNNFEDSERIISRLKNQYALGKDFVNFILYLLEKGLGKAIAKADNPVGFIMFFANKQRDWVNYQTWQSERYKREGDAVDRNRTKDFSYNSV